MAVARIKAIARMSAAFSSRQEALLPLSVALDACNGVAALEQALEAQRDVVSAVEREHGFEQVGYKLGATSQTAQATLGLQSPFVGPLFKHMTFGSGMLWPSDPRARQVRGVEAEFVVRTGRDLGVDSNDPALDDVGEVAAACTSVQGGIELVETRFAPDPDAGGVPTFALVADFGAHGGLVLGDEDERCFEVDNLCDALPGAGVSLLKNGQEVASGTGSDVLGHPFLALQWLVRYLHSQGQHLPAGSLVSTGTCVGLIPVEKGDQCVADFRGLLPNVTIDFAG